MTFRVLALTTSFPNKIGELQGSFVAHWAEALAGFGAEVRMLAPEGGDFAPNSVLRSNYRHFGHLLAQNGAPDRLFSARGLDRLEAIWGAFGSSLSLCHAAVKASKEADVVVGHWLCPCGFVAFWAARASGARCVAYAHGGDVALLEALPLGSLLARGLANCLDKIIFVSQQLRERFLRLAGRCRAQTAVIPMGVQAPSPRHEAALPWVARAAGRPIVATVGRLVPLKGYDLLPEALKGLDALWIAAGDGPERAHLEAKCRALGVDALFVGALPPEERDALLAQAAVFVLPSRLLGRRQEGMPVSLLEALVQGVSAVATRTGGVPELWREASGEGVWMIEPDDKKALKIALLNALQATVDRKKLQARFRHYLWSELGAEHWAAITAFRR